MGAQSMLNTVRTKDPIDWATVWISQAVVEFQTLFCKVLAVTWVPLTTLRTILRRGAVEAPMHPKEVNTMAKKVRDPEPKGKEKADSKHDKG